MVSAVLRNATCDLIVATVVIILDFGAAQTQYVSFGQRLFRDKADCQFCHGIDGDGRGDPRSPGRAANLRQTRLDREQIIEVIACGRPGTEMPHFDKFAYEDTNCYGLKGKDLGADAPRYPHSDVDGIPCASGKDLGLALNFHRASRPIGHSPWSMCSEPHTQTSCT